MFDSSSMAEAIWNCFKWFFGGYDEVLELSRVLPNGLLPDGSTITGFPAKELWDTSQRISHDAVAPVAITFLAIFFAVEVFHLLQRTRTEGGLDLIYQIMMMVLKLSICSFFIVNMNTLILACFQIASQINNLIQVSDSNVAIDLDEIKPKLIDHYKSQNFVVVFIAMCSIWICSLGAQIGFVLAKVVCLIRFIEIYVLTAVAPVAFATLPSSEYGSIGKTFIKRMMALALQGVLIVVSVSLYITILNAFLSANLDDFIANPTWAAVQLAGYSILLIIVLFQTGGWSKAIFQAH